MNRLDNRPTARDGKALRDRFFQLIAEGKSTKFAADAVGISDRSRTRFLQERRERGLVVEPIHPVDNIRKFAENGHRPEDIAVRFGLTPRKVREIAKENNIKFSINSVVLRPARKPIDLTEVQRLAEEGLSRTGIATRMGVDRHHMHDFIRDNNVEISWGTTKPRIKPNDAARKAAEAQRRQDYLALINRAQTLLLAGKTIHEVARALDKNYDFIYRLVRNNELRQPNFVVPTKFRAAVVTTTVGKQIVQRDTSEAGDRPCMTCGRVFRSWHKRNNQRCEDCKRRDD